MEEPWQQEERMNNYLEDEIRNAKTYLLATSSKNGENLYDHLVNTLTRILEDKPADSIDTFQELSREQKRAKFKPDRDTIQNQAEIPSEVHLANDHRCLFQRKDAEIPDSIENEVEEAGGQILGDILENAYYFEQANVGLGREETFRVFLAIKQLSDAYPFQVCRFWGKMFGIEASYYIAEAQFREGEDPYIEEDEESFSQQEAAEAKENLLLGDEDQSELDDLPKIDYRPPPLIPREDMGTGCNSKVYFVCNEPGQSWHRLPPVSPKQISISRVIKKFMTGQLDAEIVSYPPFPGNEANYLRAQIARISASTQVSPQGYYVFEENEDDDEEGIGPENFEINMEFEGLPIGELTDPSLSFWVHHMPYILPQGRCSWFNTSLPSEDEEEEEDEDEEREEPDEPEPESGPPLLTPLSEDNEVDGILAWTTQKSTGLIPQYAIAILHSNLWPGAHAFCIEKKFENIYVGWGQKYSADNYSPPVPPSTQEEYPSGPEVTETDDPTVEAERALRAAQQEALEQEEEEEEESEEYDDD